MSAALPSPRGTPGTLGTSSGRTRTRSLLGAAWLCGLAFALGATTAAEASPPRRGAPASVSPSPSGRVGDASTAPAASGGREGAADGEDDALEDGEEAGGAAYADWGESEHSGAVADELAAGAGQATKGTRAKPEPPAAPRWVKYTVIGGDRLEEIAQRYGVSKSALIRWNKLDADRPFIRKGQSLRVRTTVDVPQREKITTVVARGDTWAKIADRHGVDVDRLHLWNRKVPTQFRAGTKLVVWVEPIAEVEDAGDLAVGDKLGTRSGARGSSATPAPLKLEPIRKDGRSVGKPNRGHLVNGVQLPESPKLYTIRHPDQAWGSSHSIEALQRGIATWRRDTTYKGSLYIGDISKRGGGKLSPHSSHQSGRDVDIRLPVDPGVKGPAHTLSEVDWVAAWELIKAIIDTGEVQYVFLSYEQQKELWKAARRSGESKASLARYIQYPEPPRTNKGIVRHSKGHTVHFHVRFHCGPKDTQCDGF